VVILYISAMFHHQQFNVFSQGGYNFYACNATTVFLQSCDIMETCQMSSTLLVVYVFVVVEC